MAESERGQERRIAAEIISWGGTASAARNDLSGDPIRPDVIQLGNATSRRLTKAPTRGKGQK